MNTNQLTILVAFQRLQNSAWALMERFNARPSALEQLGKLREEVDEVQKAIEHESRANQIAELVDVQVAWFNTYRALEITDAEFVQAVNAVIAKNNAKTHETHYLSAVTGWITRKGK